MTKPGNFTGEHVQNAFGGFMAGQNALLREMSVCRQHWLESVQAQFGLTTELMHHVASAGTLPDLVNACQDCAAKRGSLVADEGKQLMDDYHRCVTTAAKCFFNGFDGFKGLTPTASS